MAYDCLGLSDPSVCIFLSFCLLLVEGSPVSSLELGELWFPWSNSGFCGGDSGSLLAIVDKLVSGVSSVWNSSWDSGSSSSTTRGASVNLQSELPVWLSTVDLQGDFKVWLLSVWSDTRSRWSLSLLPGLLFVCFGVELFFKTSGDSLITSMFLSIVPSKLGIGIAMLDWSVDDESNSAST